MLCAVAIPVLVIGIALGLPVFLPCVMLIVLRLVTADYDTAGFFLVMFGGLLGGLVRDMYPSVPIYGVLLFFLGLCLFARRLKYINKNSWRFFLLLLLLFVPSFIYGPRSEYSVNKIYHIAQNGLFAIIAFNAYDRAKHFSSTAIAQLLIMESIAMMAFAIQKGYASPSSFFDYTWLREASERMYYYTGESPLFNYQIVGMNVLYASAFLLSKRKSIILELCFYLPICIHLILSSGARQAIFGFAIVIAMRILFFSNFTRRGKIAASGITLLLMIGYFAVLFNGMVDTAAGLVSDDTGEVAAVTARSVNYLTAFECVSDHPFFGAGLGGYEPYIEIMGEQYGKWPHNMILEIMCEMGIVGLLAIIILVYLFFKQNRIPFKHITRGRLYYFLPVVALLCRFMISADLGDSVVVLSSLFAVSNHKMKHLIKRRESSASVIQTVISDVEYQFNYSVIIPYHSRYNLLLTAYNSIPDRSDIQILIIDNADEHLELDQVPKKSLASTDYLTSSPEGGAGRARNVGLQEARGRWLLFLDADDYFPDSAFNSFDKYLDSSCEVIYFKPISVKLNNGQTSTRHVAYSKAVDDYLQNNNDSFLRYWYTVPWGKMVANGLVKTHSIVFEESIASNDLMFSVKTGYYAKQICACKDVTYVVTESGINESIDKTKTREMQFARFQVAVRQYQFMDKVGLKDQRFALFSFVVDSYLSFGVKEALKYLKYAKDNRVSIFSNMIRL